MTWFNQERLKKILTFPVETVSLLNDGEKFCDEEWADYVAEKYAEGHSFFTYTSDSVDSLASCCRLKNGIQDNQFSYTLGAGGVSTGSKCVMTININRLVQNTVNEHFNTSPQNFKSAENYSNLLEKISQAVSEQVRKIHCYLTAFNSIIYDMQEHDMITIYSAGFVAPEKQYLTVGINGLVEGAEFLGLSISDNADYAAYVAAILKPIYDANKAAKTEKIMFNTEMVPKQTKSCGHLKPSLIDLKILRDEILLGQQGASVMAA